MNNPLNTNIRITVVGVGGAGNNTVQRISNYKISGLDLVALNTDSQSLSKLKHMTVLPIGKTVAKGMGSGGNPEVGRRAIRESCEQVSQLLDGSDMVFITAGMGGGTGTGAAPIIADLARKKNSLVVAIVTRPFSFEGTRRMEIANRGILQLQEKVDTLITIDNDRILSSLDGKMSLAKAFELADNVLHQGVRGISEIITVPGLINVDFADVKSVMGNAGPSFMSIGEGHGNSAATDALQAALSNPLFSEPLHGCSGVLFNLKGGRDITLDQVQEVARTLTKATGLDSQVIFGVVEERKWKKRISITLVATKNKQTRQAHKSGTHYKGYQPHNFKLKTVVNGHNPATTPSTAIKIN